MLRTLREIDQLILSREPLLKVVDVVLRHIQSISSSSALAMSLRTSTGAQTVRHFIRLHIGNDATSRQGADPMGDRGASLATPNPVWQCSSAIGPGFSEVELAGVAFLTIGAEEGPFVRVAIGQQESTSALLDRISLSSESVAELAERVAVAASAEAHETRLIFQARHDLLTSLPNRLAVLEALPSYIKHADAFSQGFATLFIDLDRFKAINDGVGHQLADVVLVEVSRRIRAAVGPEPLVARLGGDEFLVVVPKAGDAKGAFGVDQSVRQAMIAPIVVGEQQFKVDFSAGIAIYPDDGNDPESLMHNADLAMYRAKRGGGARTAAFESEMNSSATKYARMEKDLRSAIQNSELLLHYQPRVDSRTGLIVGAEALARWEHPRLGAIMPDEFISLAEECGLISEIGALIIDQACQQLAQWKIQKLELPLLAINVSSHQLRGGDLFASVSKSVQKYGVAWSELEFEITESVLVKDFDFAAGQLQQLRDAGATVAIDDFGTGYSSLAYLTRLPTDTIKIDRAFSRRLHEPETQAVILSVIALGSALNKTVVAEGVENLEDVELLGSWGCHIIQGYVYSKPLTINLMAGALRGKVLQPTTSDAPLAPRLKEDRSAICALVGAEEIDWGL